MVMYCTTCRREQPADRCTVLVRQGKKTVRRWANRCRHCGAEHVAPDPSAPGRRAARRSSAAAQRAAEAAGQLGLFGGRRR